MPDTVAALVRHFEQIYVEHMQGLPIVNPDVRVEAVAFQEFGAHELGVLITPWFMNLILLPGNDRWRESAQGDTSSVDFPSGPIEFTTSRDDEMGIYLTAVLFRSVLDLPDQATARAVAAQVMKELFKQAPAANSLSRRELLTGLRRR